MPQHFRKTHKICFLDLCVGLFFSVISLNAADYFGDINNKNVLFSFYESSYTIQENVEIGQLIFVDNNKKCG